MRYLSTSPLRAAIRLSSPYHRAPLGPQIRFNGSYEAPRPPPKDNPHRNFWRSFGRPIAKVFLGALFTYQVVYWGWLKLEALEEMHDKDAEIAHLESQLKVLAEQKGGK